MEKEEVKEVTKEEKFLEKRSEKIIRWFKNPYNLTLALIIAAVVIYRIYWFVKLGNQPLWFDEAEYMNTAKAWLGFYDMPTNPIRPVLFTLIAYGFFALGLGEGALRFFVLLFSIAAVPLIYLVGKELFDKRVGLAAAFLTGIFWSLNFYSFRLLVDIPVAVLWLATIYLFFNAYHNDKNWKWFALAGVFLGLSFLMKFSSVALIGILTVYILSTEKLNAIFNKKIITFYLSSLITVIPYFIWQYVRFGSPVAFYTFARTPGLVTTTRSFLQSLYDQTIFSVKLMHITIGILFVAGILLLIYEAILLFDKATTKKTKTNSIYFVLLWLVISLLFFGWLNYGEYMDERYYFVFYPAIFLAAGNLLIVAYDFLKKYWKWIGICVIGAVLALAAYQNITHANEIIDIKKDSFIQPRDAGLWIKERTEKEDKIIATQTQAEIQYASERFVMGMGYFNSTEDADEYIEKENINYVIVSIYYPQNMKDWELPYFFGSGKFEVVRAYEPYLDKDKIIPIVTILKAKKNESLGI